MSRISISAAALPVQRNNRSGNANEMALRSLVSLSHSSQISDSLRASARDSLGSYGLQRQSETISSTAAARANSAQANSLLSTANGALAEIGSLLNEIREAATLSANASVLQEGDLQASQSIVDAAVESINRIASTAEFAGQPLLTGGELRFQVGAKIDSASQVSVDLGSFLATSLGGENGAISSLLSGGENSLRDGGEQIAEIVDAAIGQVASARARIGSMQSNSLQPMNALNSVDKHFAGGIVESDFAQAIVDFQKLQILSQAGASALNYSSDLTRPQATLSLLG